MSNYFNEAGEPLMDGSAMRYEMYLDSLDEAEPDYFLNNGVFVDDFIECESEVCDEDVRDCGHDGRYGDQYEGMEDQWLDGSYEE